MSQPSAREKVVCRQSRLGMWFRKFSVSWVLLRLHSGMLIIFVMYEVIENFVELVSAGWCRKKNQQITLDIRSSNTIGRSL